MDPFPGGKCSYVLTYHMILGDSRFPKAHPSNSSRLQLGLSQGTGCLGEDPGSIPDAHQGHFLVITWTTDTIDRNSDVGKGITCSKEFNQREKSRR